MRDPYAIYARRVLKLEALEPIAADPGAAERGQFIHQALDAFVKAHPHALPADALEKLIGFGQDAFGKLLAQPEVWAFWWPRFERVAAWFVLSETERRRTIRPLATEVKGKLVLEGPAGPFTLRAKADRIDKLPDGGLAIIDYKTGSPPYQHRSSPGLRAATPPGSRHGRAPAASSRWMRAPVGAMAFWKLSGGEPAGSEIPIKGDLAVLAEQARAGLADADPHLRRPRHPLPLARPPGLGAALHRLRPSRPRPGMVRRRRGGPWNEHLPMSAIELSSRRDRPQRQAAPRLRPGMLRLGRRLRRHRQDQGADRPRAAAAAGGHRSRRASSA